MVSRPEHLERAAQRASLRPSFLAWVFARFRQIEQINEAELAALLGLGESIPPRLALMGVPTPDLPLFVHQVREMATAVGASSEQLARVIRRVWAIDCLSAMPNSDGRGLLAAARDRVREREDDCPVKDEQREDL